MKGLNFNDERVSRLLELLKASKGKHLCLSCAYAPKIIDDSTKVKCQSAQMLMRGHDGLTVALEKEGGARFCNINDKGVTAGVDIEFCPVYKTGSFAGDFEREGDKLILFRTNRFSETAEWVTLCNHYREIPDTDKYHIYLQSDEWRQKRQEAINRAGYRCQICGDCINLQVHHITYDRLGEEPEDDLVVLCKSCHEKVHSGKYYLKIKGRTK